MTVKPCLSAFVNMEGIGRRPDTAGLYNWLRAAGERSKVVRTQTAKTPPQQISARLAETQHRRTGLHRMPFVPTERAMSAHCHHDDLDWANVLAEQIIADVVGNNYKVAEKKIAARLRENKLEIEAETLKQFDNQHFEPYGDD